MVTESITFTGSSGTSLSAALDLPRTPPRCFAVFAHCFTCGKDLAVSSRVSRALAAHGIGVLRFDFTGLGESPGQFDRTDFDTNIEDLLMAADWLATHHAPPQLFIGHSFGGSAAIAAARFAPSVTAVATVGAPLDLTHLERLFVAGIDEIEQNGSALVHIGERPFRIGRELLTTLRSSTPGEIVSQLNRPLLVMHSPTDAIVPFDHAARIVGAAGPGASRVAVIGADHLLSEPSDATYVADVIASWSTRYVVDSTPAAPIPPRHGSQVVVAETTQVGLLNEADLRGHRILIDEPISNGGHDAGPSPGDLLAAALAGCTSITVRMYAERKGFPLERVAVRVDHDHISGLLRRAVELDGPLDDDQRGRLMSIAERCPVHKALSHANRIVTAAGSELPEVPELLDPPTGAADRATPSRRP